MLEYQENVVLCGGLILGSEFCPVYIRDTGDVLYEEESGPMLIDGLTEINPIELPSTDAVELALRSNGFGPGVIGVVYVKDHVVVLTSETSAQRRQWGKHLEQSNDLYPIDLNAVDPLADEYED